MRFAGRGHEAVRATHDKTLELIPGPTLTERGTCIVAVAAVAEPALATAGPVRVSIAAGASTFAFDAVGNPSWVPGGPIVVRRGPARLPGTFATEATAAAADLPRELVVALRDPAARVAVDVSPAPTDVPTVVLFLADASSAADPRLDAELTAADTVLAEDADALRLIGRHAARPGHRTLVVATRALPGRSASATATTLAAGRIETVGLPATLACVAASPGPAPATFCSVTDVRAAPPAHRLALTVGADELPGVLALAAEVRGTTGAVLAQENCPPQRVADGGTLPALPSRDTVHLCLPPAAVAGPDPAVRAAIVALLGDGVPTRSAARALATLTGWDRRRAYDAVLAWRE